MSRFTALFDRWASTYDETVHRRDGEYAEVFEGYASILERVVDAVAREPGARVLDVGTGTGNLARRLLARGYRVVGVEPSEQMRLRAATVEGLDVRSGDFLNLPVADGEAAAIVSTYAFHHLTDEEKAVAARGFARALDANGRVVFADTAFRDAAARQFIHRRVEAAGHRALLADLQSEYYTTLDVLERAFGNAGLETRFEPLNRYVWLIEAGRGNRVNS